MWHSTHGDSHKISIDEKTEKINEEKGSPRKRKFSEVKNFQNENDLIINNELIGEQGRPNEHMNEK